MKQIIELIIEEFESGAWVADVVSLDEFTGSFDFAGVTWTGTLLSSQEYVDRITSKIIGGKNGISKTIQSQWYDGSVSVQVGVQDVCRLSGETFGSAQTGKVLNTFQRHSGPAYEALNAIAEAFDLMWWIGRDGQLRMLSERTSSATVVGELGERGESSVIVTNPQTLEIGSTLDDKTIRHIRWRLTQDSFYAEAYFVPFIFRPPTNTKYSRMYNAKVDKQNSDDTIDVIADGKFGVTKVPLFCGIPHSKVKIDPGDQVILGFFGASPQKPFAVAMSQDTGATKEVARKGDSIDAGSLLVVSPGVGTCTITYVPAGGVPVPGTTALDGGKVTSGSARIKIGDAS